MKSRLTISPSTPLTTTNGESSDYVDETVLCDDTVALCDDTSALTGILVIIGKVSTAIIRPIKNITKVISGAIMSVRTKQPQQKGAPCLSSPQSSRLSPTLMETKPLLKITTQPAIIKSTRNSQLSQPKLAPTAPRIQTHSTKKPRLSEPT